MLEAEAAKTAESFASSLGTMRMAGLAVAAAGGAVALFAKSIIDAADGLNDMSQRVGISVRELGKYQLAAEQSGASLESISKGVKGLSDNMIKHGDALRKAGVDATTADGAMQQLADVFEDMPDGIEKTALATKLFGKAGMDLIPMLNLGSEGLRDAALASADYAEQMAIMAPLADALNDSMAEIALASKTAGAAMVNEFLPTLNAIALAFLDSKDNANGFASVAGGTVKTVLQTLALVTSDVVFVLNGMGREIGAIAAQVAALGRLDFKGFTAIGDAVKEDAARARKELDKWQSDLVNGVAKADAAVQSAYNKRQGFGEKSGARGSRLLGDLGGDSAAKKALAEQNKELANQAKILAELSGYTADYEATQQRYAAMLKSGAMSQEAYNRAAQELVAKQPGMTAAKKAEAEALKEIQKLQSDYAISLQKSVIAGDEELAKAQAAYDAHGKLASVLQEELLARMEITREQIAGGAGSETELNAITQQIKDKRELIKVLRNGEVRDASEKAAKDAAAEWKKASEKIEQDITDALMRGFESGKGFAEVLRDTIENTFKTMVIRPVIQATVQGGLNAVGLGSAQGGGTINGIGGAINTANSMNSIYAAGSQFLYGSSVGASAASLAAGNMAGMVGGDALGTMIAANGSWAGVSAGTAAGTAAAGTAATGAGAASSLAAAGPYVAAAIAAYMIADSLFGSKGGPKTESTYGSAYGQLGDTSNKGLAGTYATGVEDAWKTLAKELEITTALKVGAQTSIDTQGDAQTIFDAYGTVNGQVVSSRAGRLGSAENVGRDEAALQAAMAEETTRLLFAALKASDLPEQYKTYLNTIGDSAAEMTEAMTIVAVVDDFNDALQSLPFENLKTLSFEAAKGLMEVAGGMDVLGANLGTYYTNFYSAEEQRLQTIKTINAATAGSGLDAATATREQFRQIVEAQDLTTEAGRETYAALLGVSGAMGTLTKESEAAAESLKKALADLFGSLDDAVSAALSAVEAAVSAERDALSAAYDTQAQQISDSIDTVSASVGKLQSLADSLKSTLDGMRISGSDAQYRAAAQSQISAALATARAGGGLPLDGQLTSALAAVSKPSEQLFATFEDYARDFYSTANDISALGDLTNDQLSLEQATLAALETQSAILEASYKAQLSILDATLANAQAQAGADSGLMTLSAALYALVNALSQKTYFEANPDVANAYAKNDYGLSASDYATVHYGLYGKNEGRTSPNGAPADTAKSYFELYPDVAAAFAANAYGMSQIEYSARHFANFGKAEGRVFPGFAVGTNYVPSDMIAQIHEGEAIVPKAYNPAAGGQNNAELVAEIRALRQEVASLKASNEATAANTKKFASQFETASEGGRALLTEVYA